MIFGKFIMFIFLFSMSLLFSSPPEGYNENTLKTLASMVDHNGECFYIQCISLHTKNMYICSSHFIVIPLSDGIHSLNNKLTKKQIKT